MELRHLRYFVAAAEAASISRAAAAIGVTQPALSRQIRDLEEELGVRLFDRIGGRVRLTEDGRDLMRSSRDALAQADAVSERARALKDGSVGTLHVGATPQVLQGHLPSLLRRYRRSHPQVDIQLIEAGGARVAELVERGEVHVGLCRLLDRSIGVRVRARVLFPTWVLAVTSKSHPLRHESVVEVSKLVRERLLLLTPAFGTRELFDTACRTTARPRIVLESSAPDTLVSLARAEHGVAIIPSTVNLGRDVKAMPVVHRGKSLVMWAAIMWDPRRYLPPYAERFTEMVAAHFAKSYPGKQFARVAPPGPRPSEPKELGLG
jgi:LysR family transcriptional regulator, cyn operon transcriptional activator